MTMEQSTQKNIMILAEDGVGTILLNRPNVLNAMTLEMFHELQQLIEQVASDPSIEVVVLRGAGGNFCSGADISVLAGIRNRAEADEALDVINSFISRLHTIEKPVIAVIEGVAVGAGLNLALQADFVVATEQALLQEPFVHIGLTTDFGGTYLLPRLVGMAQAKRLAMLGEKISGTEAERIGLIYKAVTADSIESEVEKLISTLRRLPRAALIKTKEGLGISSNHSLDHMLAWEKESQPALLLHPDFQRVIGEKLKRK